VPSAPRSERRALHAGALPAALALLVLLAFAPGSAAAGGAPELVSIPIEALRGRVDPAAPHAFNERGLELAVDGTTSVVFPGAAQVVELDVDTAGVVLVTWASRTYGQAFTPFGPPWRHLTLAEGRTTVRLDFRITRGWTPGSELLLGFTGAGTVVIRGVRALPPERDRERQLAAYDRANFWAPESIGHTTINVLTPSRWSESRGSWLTGAIAAAAAVAFAAALLVVAFTRGRRARPALALAVASLAAAGLWDLHLLTRFLPAFDLRPTPDPETRIRENYWVAPDVGAVVALARKTLGPTERVGVVGREKDWFTPQTICFNLAPRPCVVMQQGKKVHRGISGVGELRDDEIDAIVSFRAEWTPPGFERVAALGPTRFLARRR
jgi:hypothetical protein